MRRTWLARGIAAGVIVGVAVYARLVVWPWYVEPPTDAVARVWAPVEGAAIVAPDASDGARLDAFADAARAARNDLGERLHDENAHPEAPRAPLPASMIDALAALRAWSVAPGPSGTPAELACTTTPDFTRTMTLPSFARTALAASAEATEARLRATDLVRLSEHLRRTGSIEDYLIGLKILDAVVGWAQPLGPAPDFLVATHADDHELEAAIARHFVCTDRFLGRARQATYAGHGVFETPWFTRRYVSLDRERAVYRLYGGDLLAHCHPQLDDVAAYVACTSEQPEVLPKSAAVRALPFVPVPGVVPVLVRYRAATR